MPTPLSALPALLCALVPAPFQTPESAGAAPPAAAVANGRPDQGAPFEGPGQPLGSSTLKHKGELLCVERIGERLVTITQGGEVGLWSADAGERLGGLELGDVATGWTVTEDGRILLTLRAGRVVAVDSSGSGSVETVLQAEGNRIAAGGPASEWIAVLSDLAPVRAFGDPDAEPFEWDLGRQVITSAEFDDAGRLIVVAMNRDRMFKRGHAMDQPTTQIFVLVPGSEDWTSHALFEESRSDAFALLPEGLAVAADDAGRIVLVEVDSGERRAERLVGLTPVVGLRYAPETHTVWSMDSSGRVLELDPETLEERGATDIGQPFPRSWSLIEGGTQHLIGRNNRGEVLQAETGEALLVAAGHVAPVVQLDFDPAGERLVSASYDSSAIVWDLGTRMPLQTVTSHEGFVYAARFSPSGETLATGGKDGTVQLHRGPGEPAQVLRFHRGAVTDLAWGRTDAQLASVGGDSQVVGWDLERGAERWIQDVPSGVLFRAARSGAELLIAESSVTSFDLASGARRAEPARYDAIVTSAAGHERAAALGLANGWVQVLERSAGELQPSSRLGPHAGRVEAAAFDPSGSLLAVGSANRVTLWAVGGDRLGELGPLDSPVMAIAFSADGATLAVGTQTGSILTWKRR